MLQERNQRSSNGCNLVRTHVNEVNLFGRNNGEVGLTTGLDALGNNVAVFVLGSGGLSNRLVLLQLGGVIGGLFVQHYAAIDNTAIRGLNETKIINLSIDAQRGDKTDVGAFRGLDGAETTVMGIVNVADFEACALARQTTRT